MFSENQGRRTPFEIKNKQMEIEKMITSGMTPQEKKIYSDHMRQNHYWESLKVEEEKERISEYKQAMITDILKHSTNWTKEELRGFSTKRLERICDAIC